MTSAFVPPQQLAEDCLALIAEAKTNAWTVADRAAIAGVQAQLLNAHAQQEMAAAVRDLAAAVREGHRR